jgi:acetolactate synthase-1/3 small subunit
MNNDFTRHFFAVLVSNEPGILARVVGLFSGRGYNIDSLTVDEVDSATRLSRITIVTSGPAAVIRQIKQQLKRLIPVREVVDLTEAGAFVESGLVYAKVIGDAKVQAEAEKIADKAGAKKIDVTGAAVIYELAGPTTAIDSFLEKLRSCGLAEIARTGSLALSKGEAILCPPADGRDAA